LFKDRLLIGLSSAEMSVVRYRGLFKPTRIETGSVACDPAFGNEPWQGAVSALKAVPIGDKCSVTLVLSNQFVRYAIVPWSSALGTTAEEDAYVRHHFAKIHGERAKAWTLRATESAAGAPRLASAIDTALLAAIREALQEKPLARLISVQPQLMSKFNEWRSAIPASGAWLVLAEPERACVALHAAGQWRSVQNGKGAWRALLDRERHRVDGEIPNLVLIAGAEAPSNDGEWQFRAMSA
jgi:hypothetical protein